MNNTVLVKLVAPFAHQVWSWWQNIVTSYYTTMVSGVWAIFGNICANTMDILVEGMGGGVKRPEKHWKMDKPKSRLLWVAHLVQNLISNETIEIVCDLEWVLTTTLGASASLSEHERGGVARQSHAYACKWTCLSSQGCQLRNSHKLRYNINCWQ